MNKPLPYATRIVRLCGGPSALAREIGVSRTVVHHWTVSGSIPDKHKVKVSEAARKLGVPLTPKDFWPEIAE